MRVIRPPYPNSQGDLQASWAYDSEGRITDVTYPQWSLAYPNLSTTVPGSHYTNVFDTMGRPNTMTDQISTNTLISGVTYGAGSQILSIAGIVSETRAYNNLQQLTSLLVNVSGGNVANLQYGYSATQNNGKIISQTDAISGEQITYTYDALNRLANAVTSDNPNVTQWGQSYGYDGFGNLTDQNVIKGSAPTLHVVYSAANNRAGDPADANGNIGNYVYDIENRIVQVASTTVKYAYDAGNKRVWRGDSNNGIDEVVFYGVSGQKLGAYRITVYGGSLYFTMTGTNVYFGAKFLAKGAVGGSSADNMTLTPVVADRLGSIGKFYPYGQERPSATANDTEKFTGYYRDAATGLDYADQRYHQPGMGRFMTDDPSGDNWNPADPGSWNTYAYVGGNPINLIDPDGLSAVVLPPIVPGTNCSTAFINYASQFGLTIQGLFDSDAGLLGLMSFFEQQGSGTAADQNVWAALDWTFLNQWDLSSSDKTWFYGRRNVPATFAATVTTGRGRSQVFTTTGALTQSTALLNILTGSPFSSECSGLATAFDVAQGTVNAHNGTEIPGLLYIPNPVPGALQFGSNGRVPTHSRFVRQTMVGTVPDGPNVWTFYADKYTPPRPRRPSPPPDIQ